MVFPMTPQLLTVKSVARYKSFYRLIAVAAVVVGCMTNWTEDCLWESNSRGMTERCLTSSTMTSFVIHS